MYKLSHFPFSQHSRRVVSLLAENHIPYEIQIVDLAKAGHLSPAFLELNPNHQVPVLQDGDFTLYESNAILRYVCNRHQLQQWYPNDAQTRGIVDQWLDWNQCRLASAVVDIVLNKVFLGTKGDAEAVRRGEGRLRELLPILEHRLHSRTYLATDRPTIADLSVFSNIFQLGLAGITPSGATRSWYQRLLDRAGVQASLPKL